MKELWRQTCRVWISLVSRDGEVNRRSLKLAQARFLLTTLSPPKRRHSPRPALGKMGLACGDVFREAPRQSAEVERLTSHGSLETAAKVSFASS